MPFSLGGCSKDSPKRAVKKELNLIKELDESTIKAFVSYEDMMSSHSSSSDVGIETTEAVKRFFQNFDYKIKSSSVEDKKATVHVEITNLDMRALAKDICLALVKKGTGSGSSENMTLNSYFALLGDVLSENTYDLVTTEADIKLLKTEDGWMLQNTDQLEDDLVSGFITYLKDPYLVTPEEIINVVMEGLKEKSPDQWKSYLNMHDIFPRTARTMRKWTMLIAEQLSNVSLINPVGSGRPGRKICHGNTFHHQLDMERVLKHYQDLLIHYAATSKSLRASSSELADETAALLAQALTENTDTTDTEVTIHFTNNGSSWEIQLNEDFTNALLGNAGAAIQAFQNGSVDVSDSVSDTEQ